MVPETKINGTSRYCLCANLSADMPSKAGSAKSERIRSKLPRLSAATKSSRVCTRAIAHVMPPASRVDRTSAASFGSSSKCRMWSGDFIGNLVPFGGDDFTALYQRFCFPGLRRRFIDSHPKDAEPFDHLHELGEIHGLHYVGVGAVLVTLDQVRLFAR